MSAPQFTDRGTSTEWFRGLGQSPGGTARSPSQALLVVNARRQHFTRLVTYTMGGLVAFTLLGLACFAWRHHSMQAELAATPPPTVPAAAAARAQPLTSPAPDANTDAPAPPAPAPAAAPLVAKPKAVPFKRPAKLAPRTTLTSKSSKLGTSAASTKPATRR